MSGMQGAAPLPGGTQVDACVIDSVAERATYSVRYLAHEGGRPVVLREFLPQTYSVRDGSQLLARQPEDRNALRWWLRSFIEQTQVLARLRHPALPRVERVFEANGTAYAVAEPVAGEALAALLAREGTLDEARLRRVLHTVIDGLDQAHAAGLLHRDIRPQTVLVRADGSGTLIDFAVLRAPVRLKSGLLSGAGEPPYAAPEELSATGSYGAWTDVYSLGALAYRAISGIEPPAARERLAGAALSPAAQVARVRASEALLQSIDWALSLSPSARPQTLAAWRAALQAQPLPDPPSLLPAPVPRRRSKAGPVIGIAIATVVLLGLAYLGLNRPVSPPVPSSVPPPPPAEEAAAPAAPASPAAPEQTPSSLDRLALELMSKDRKTQEQAREQKKREEQDKLEKDERERKAREALEKTTARGETLDKAPVKTADKPPRPAGPAAAVGEADPASSARTRELEEEIARLKAERSQQAQETDAARAAREKASRDAEAAAAAERERQLQVIARARKSCKIPAPTLSAAGNLTFETAMRVPGAERIGSNVVRLPPIATADGDTRQFDITPDSCARLVN